MSEGEFKKRIALIEIDWQNEFVNKIELMKILDEAAKDFPYYAFGIDWQDDEDTLSPQGAIEDIEKWFKKWFPTEEKY